MIIINLNIQSSVSVISNQSNI